MATRSPGHIGLVARNVFLDTEAFHRVHYDLTNPVFTAFRGYVENQHLVLHTTDITLFEIERHILEDAQRISREARTLDRSIRDWNRRFQLTTPIKIPQVDANALADTANLHFRLAIVHELDAIGHVASKRSAEQIFDQYFARKPPFDDANSKEFPDAFVVAALSDWCTKNETTMYVVTADKAMLRAVEASTNLFGLDKLETLLEEMSAAETPEVVEIAEKWLAREETDRALNNLIEEHLLEDVSVLYRGDLSQGEITEVTATEFSGVTDFHVLAITETQIQILVTLEVSITANVQYEDYSTATHDSEDDTYYGIEIEECEIEDRVSVRAFFTVARSDLSIIETGFVSHEVAISEPYETYK